MGLDWILLSKPQVGQEILFYELKEKYNKEKDRIVENDAEEAEQAVNEYRKKGFKGPVYLMPCGGVERVYSMNNRKVAELAMQKGWRYSDRLQVPLFKNEWGT